MSPTEQKLALIVITAIIGFLFGLVRLGINRLIKGQDDAKKSAEERVNGLRDDIKEVREDIKSHGDRLTAVETRCDMEHGGK